MPLLPAAALQAKAGEVRLAKAAEVQNRPPVANLQSHEMTLEPCKPIQKHTWKCHIATVLYCGGPSVPEHAGIQWT